MDRRKDEGRNSKNEWLQSLSKRVLFPELHLAVPLKAGWFTCLQGIFETPKGNVWELQKDTNLIFHNTVFS